MEDKERVDIFIDGSNFYHGLKKDNGDFVPAVKAVQTFGKHVENYYFKTGHSWHLR